MTEINGLLAVRQVASPLIELAVATFWVMLPAYFANSAPVVFQGERPLDGNRSWRGKPILGPGKTVRGTICGFLSGLVATVLLIILRSLWTLPNFLPNMSLALGSLLAAGALIGDISASFFKRRMGLEQGDPVLILDQLDFYLGAWLLSCLIFFDLRILFMGLLLTPLIHKSFNLLAFKLSLKDVAR